MWCFNRWFSGVGIFYLFERIFVFRMMKEIISLFVCGCFSDAESVDVVMETKGGKKKSSSSSSLQYEVPLGYIIEDVRPNGGIEKFRSAAYSNVRSFSPHVSFGSILKHFVLSF